VDLVQIAERLEDESVHAAGEQARYLAREQRLGLLARGGAEGLDPDAERADRADDARLPPAAARASSAAVRLMFSSRQRGRSCRA